MGDLSFRGEVDVLAFGIGLVLLFLFLGALGGVLGFAYGFLRSAWRSLHGRPLI